MNRPAAGLCGARRDQRSDAGEPEHVEHRAADPGEIDYQLGAGQLAHESADMPHYARVRRTQGQPLQIADPKNLGHGNLAKSSTKAGSINSLENALDCASINSPSYSWAKSSGPSLRRW